MNVPTPNTTCYWNDRGEVREVVRRGGFCASGRDNYIPVTFFHNDHEWIYLEAHINDFFTTEAEALDAAIEWADKLVESLAIRRMEISNLRQ